MNTKYVIKNAEVSPDDYNELREKSGIGNRKSKENAETAIENSLFITSIYDGDKLIAMARVVGDGAISLVVTDVMVDSEYQKNGLGRVLMNEINKYLDENYDEDSYIILLANTPYDAFYEKFHFKQFPNKKGMLRVL
ncbi:GNAT family N-acetyltransferase [Finegoldia magna]|uniref:GNAT family N-acetyltransferase n=1 Tax=Finegoldia magna TaxID=1260 RepID=UPI00290AD0D0|nr:GNAT family N-acetyltransferase [Finegoldia magna]MDU5200885.1 GNAT family N-acetyltransferase [Finegoldia magna]MDU6775666.1 GNAT family N-acetyltransferase [Finegoldia magna]